MLELNSRKPSTARGARSLTTNPTRHLVSASYSACGAYPFAKWGASRECSRRWRLHAKQKYTLVLTLYVCSFVGWAGSCEATARRGSVHVAMYLLARRSLMIHLRSAGGVPL